MAAYPTTKLTTQYQRQPDRDVFDYVRFTVVDFHGISRSKTVPKARLPQFIKEGCSFFAGKLHVCVIPQDDHFVKSALFLMFTGFLGFSLVGPLVPQNIPCIHTRNASNVFARPDLDTLHELPENGAGRYKVGQVFCDTWYSDGTRQNVNPRSLAKDQLARLHQMGLVLKSSWELEVCFLDEQSLKPNFDRNVFVFSNSKFDEMEAVMFEAHQAFDKMGIGIETLQTEASPGQYEFVTCPVLGIKQADHLVVMKDTLRHIAKKHKLKAVFMAEPFGPEYPSYATALNFNHSIGSTTGKAVFVDVFQADKLSELCKHWLAGLLKHSAGLTALVNPTVNCYRRLNRNGAGKAATWGLDTRRATYRVKNNSPESTYIECRSPSGAANPYLVMAATLAAGIDGLVNKYDLPASLSADEKSSIIPITLSSALHALREDTCLTEALGQTFVDWFCLVKQKEVDKFENFDPESSNQSGIELERECYMDVV